MEKGLPGERREVMKRSGTDMLAVACILGGAVVGGMATVAYLAVQGDTPAGCTIETVTATPNIVVSRRGESRAVVLTTPQVRVHSRGGCAHWVPAEVSVQVRDGHREVEEFRVQMEESRARMQETMKTMVHLREAQLIDAEAVALERLEEAEIVLEEVLLKKAEKIEKGSGGQF
jgi:hypothetical protein